MQTEEQNENNKTPQEIFQFIENCKPQQCSSKLMAYVNFTTDLQGQSIR